MTREDAKNLLGQLIQHKLPKDTQELLELSRSLRDGTPITRNAAADNGIDIFRAQGLIYDAICIMTGPP